MLNGKSLLAFRDYFEEADIVGMDIGEDRRQYADGRVSIHIGNQGDYQCLAALCQDFLNFDVIIDDAGHDIIEQQMALRYLWPKLNNHGCYVIEDLESSYWPKFGPFRNPSGTMEVIKRAMEGINKRYVFEQQKLEPPTFEELSELYSAHWFPNIVFRFKNTTFFMIDPSPLPLQIGEAR